MLGASSEGGRFAGIGEPEHNRGELAGAPGFRNRARVWCVYLLRCADGTLYTGITNDLPGRLAAHASGRGARYTRGRGPFALLHNEPARTRSAALRREHELKRLRRRDKLAFLDTPGRHG